MACYIMLQDLQFRVEAGDRRGFMKEAPGGGNLPPGLWKAMTQDLKEEWPEGDSEEDSDSDDESDEEEDAPDAVAHLIEQQQRQAAPQPSAVAAAQAVDQAMEQEPPVESTRLPPGALKAMPRAAEQCSAAAAVADSEEFEEVESCIEIEVTPEDQQQEAQPSASLAGPFSKLAGAEAGSPPVTEGMKGSVPEATAAASQPPRSMAAAIERLRMRSRRPPVMPEASASGVSWPTAAEQYSEREPLAQAAEPLARAQTEDAAEIQGSEPAPLSDDVWEQQLIDQRIEEMGKDATDSDQASSDNSTEDYNVIDEIASLMD